MAKEDTQGPLWLLLLPFPQSELSLHTFKVLYGPSLTQTLKDASASSSVLSSLSLDIVCFYRDGFAIGISSLQRIFGIMYKLICLICAEQRIDIQYQNDVDVRLVLCRMTLNQCSHPDTADNKKDHGKVSFSDLKTLAKTDRAWQRILAPDGESGEELLQAFLQIMNANRGYTTDGVQIERVPGGLTICQDRPRPNGATRFHHSIAVGGTFDHLHVGHKLLLTMTALLLEPDPEVSRPRCITVGITGDELLKNKKYRDQMENFSTRQAVVQSFLLGILELISPTHILQITQRVEKAAPFGREVHNTLRSGLTIRYVEIFDPCGPTITDEAISALVISAETRSGGKVVNDKRAERGWPALEVFEVDVLDAEGDESDNLDGSFQNKISSTDIRRRIFERTITANVKCQGKT